MKIKVIELLNMIAKGEEVPRKIKCNHFIFEWNKEYKRYYHCSNFTFGGSLSLDGILNDEVEIIEDKPKEIEKIKIYEDENNNCYIINENGTKCYMTKHYKVITKKLNELIDKVSEMSKDD